MGNTKPQQSNPSIPPQLLPLINQASTQINGFQVPNLSGSGAGQAATALGTAQFAPGGTIANMSDYYNKLMSGSMLDPNTNPYLKSTMDANMTAFNQALGSGLDASNAQFNLAGQGTGGATAQTNQRLLTQNALKGFSESQGSQLFGTYQNGTQQMLAALGMGNPVAAAGSAAYNTAAAPTLQQTQLSQIPIQMLMSLIGATPLATTQYGPSEFAQNFGMAAQGTGALAGLIGAFN